MAYLPVTFLAALAIAVSVYSETGSFLFSLLAYAGTGSFILLLALVVAALSDSREQVDQANLVTD